MEARWHAFGVDGKTSDDIRRELEMAGVELHDHAGVAVVACNGGLFEQRMLEPIPGLPTILIATEPPSPLPPVEDMIVWRGPGSVGQAVAGRLRRWEHVDRIARSELVKSNLVGESRAWRTAIASLIEAACFTELPVLILGESGTGKELAARLLHTLRSEDDGRQLVVLDCSALIPELAGSELFGHVRGAFTGAEHSRDGAFALADGGTLFLDEIGEVPLGLQASLLRVLQEGTYKRVGEDVWRRTEFRPISATNRPMKDLVECGAFRCDLFFRLAGWIVRLPSLGERRSDILPLAHHFLRELLPESTPDFDPAVAAHLISRDYRGNVRELRQLVHRLVARHAGGPVITLGALAGEDDLVSRAASWRQRELVEAVRAALSEGVDLKAIGRAATDAAVALALTESDSVKQAADRLGVTERALQLRRAAYK